MAVVTIGGVIGTATVYCLATVGRCNIPLPRTSMCRNSPSGLRGWLSRRGWTLLRPTSQTSEPSRVVTGVVADGERAAVAAELAMMSEFVGGERSGDLGLVTGVADDVDGATYDVAERLASKPPLAIQIVKESVGMAIETELQAATTRFPVRRPTVRHRRPDGSGRGFNREGSSPTVKGQ